MVDWLTGRISLCRSLHHDDMTPAMALEGTQSDVLKQLGVSYPQLIDYYSKQHAATLVSPAQTCRSHTQIDIGTSLRLGTGNMGLYHYIVSSPPSSWLNIVDTPHK